MLCVAIDAMVVSNRLVGLRFQDDLGTWIVTACEPSIFSEREYTVVPFPELNTETPYPKSQLQKIIKESDKVWRDD